MKPEEILESISDAFYAVDDAFRLTYVNRVAEAWWGRCREELIGKHFWSEFPEAVGSATYEAHLAAARERRVIRLEAVSPIVGHWVDISIFPGSRGLSVYFRDISERKRAEARQRLLVHELNHRVKNTLATVQAIAAQTFRGPNAEPEARERFTSRLVALARANDLLVAETWHGASLCDVVSQVTGPYGGPEETTRFAISGPDLLLNPKATTALSLALHELATNAAKYGALSQPGGTVSIAWQAPPDPEGRFRLTWTEAGGPQVRAPTDSGFGRRLLQRGVAYELGAEVGLEFRPEGLRCVIDAPLSEVAAFAEAA